MMKINIATVHWKSRFFQDIQYRQISSNFKDFRIWAFLDKVGSKREEDSERYYFHDDSGETNHLVKLDMLADMICNKSDAEDVILFMDGDAWPVRSVNDFLYDSLKNHPVGGVIRSENGERYPHPSFTYTTIGYWREAELNWSKHDINHILHVLEARNEGWTKIRRSRGLAEHPVFFSFYGDMVYHHGAGFRMPVSAYCNRSGIKISKEESLDMLNVFMQELNY